MVYLFIILATVFFIITIVCLIRQWIKKIKEYITLGNHFIWEVAGWASFRPWISHVYHQSHMDKFVIKKPEDLFGLSELLLYKYDLERIFESFIESARQYGINTENFNIPFENVLDIIHHGDGITPRKAES